MIYLNLFLIAVIVTYCLDVSGFKDEITSKISSWLTKGVVKQPFDLKPFTCSLCMTFWTGLVYLLIVGGVSFLSLTWLCLCSYLTLVLPSIFYFVESVIVKFFKDLGNWINLE